MNAVSALGYGAIGLGFLLAVLSFRLLSVKRTDHAPVYIYMAFCLALVVIGAGLQVYESRARQDLVVSSYDSKLREVQEAETSQAKNSTDRISGLTSQINGLRSSMKVISEKLSETQNPLQQALSLVSDPGACPGGGKSGQAMPHSANASDVISFSRDRIADANSIARQNQ